MKKLNWAVISLTVLLIIGVVFAYVSKPRKKVCPLVVEPSSIKLVDDFNDGVDPNCIGGSQLIYISDKAFCRSLYSKIEMHGDCGFSTEVSFYVPLDGWAIWGVNLNELDISAAEKLSFWVKGAKGGEKFELILEDGKNKVELDTSFYIENISKEWQQISIPVSDFKGIDFNHLTNLSFIFKGIGGEKSGTIYIDDIGFEGRPELFFNSLKDNLYSFPTRQLLEKRKKELLAKKDEDFLRQIAKDTWDYFEDIIDTKHHLPLDSIDLTPKQSRISDYTSPTNMGLYFMCVISAYDLGFIDKTEATDRLLQSLSTIEKLPKWNGMLYNFYSTTNLQIGRKYISSVDNGWLAASLIVARQAFPQELGEICSRILRRMDFSQFYNKQLGQMSIGYDTEIEALSPYHYGLIATEPRVLSFIAAGKKDVPKEHWFKVFRTLPKEWEWQSQIPKGETRRYLGIDVFEGYYTYGGIKIVPSWGGSLFEFLMPTLVMKEKELAPEGLGLNDLNAIRGHIKFSTEKDYPVWGLSPSTTPNSPWGGYTEFGVAALGSKGYKDEGVVTPHVSFLSLYLVPKEAVDNIRKFLELYPIYGEYGLYDSVNVNTGMIGYNYLALDQGMTLLAINNYLNNGVLRERFHQDEYIKDIENVLSIEKFF